MKLTSIVFCLALLGGALTSCIDEDIDDCFSINRLTLSYKGDGTTEIFPDKICRVEMYVFDAENKCVNSHTLSDDELASRTALLPPLKAGDYRIVCVGNTHHTRVEGLTTCDFNKIVFADGDYFAGKQVSGNDSLYHASTSYTVLPFTGREEDDQTKTIEFASSHYDLFVEVVGIPAVGKRAGSLPVLEICGVSPCTDFENRACGEATDYLLETTYESGKKLLTARANIMRHMNHRDVNVCLRQASGEELLAEINRDCAIILVSHDIGTVLQQVKNIACVNETLDYHPAASVNTEWLERNFNCPIELLGHGTLPHRVLGEHCHCHEDGKA